MAEATGIVMTTPTLEEIVREDEQLTKQKMRLDSARHGSIAVRIIEAAAPRDTGELARSIHQRQRRRRGGQFATGFEVIGGAARDGFPYLDVTRFGHAKAFILPKRSLSLKVHFAGRNYPPVQARFVRGYRPKRDWVEHAVNQADPRDHEGRLMDTNDALRRDGRVGARDGARAARPTTRSCPPRSRRRCPT